jgi:hypothetical protein
MELDKSGQHSMKLGMGKCKSSITILMALGLLLLGGFASVPEGSEILRQQAKSMAPPDGMTAIYVFRPNMPPGDTLWLVNLDSKHFGYLAPKSYLFGIVPSGQHMLDLGFQEARLVTR